MRALWPILINTYRRREAYRADLDRYRQDLRLSPQAHPLAIVLPAASPYIVTGLRVSLSIALILVTTAEMIAGSKGLGFFILDEERSLQSRNMLRRDHSGGGAGLPAQSSVLGFRGKSDEMASRHGCAGSNLSMRESKLNGVLFLLALLLVWELAARAEWVNPLIVPAVSKIVGTFSELFWSGQIPVQILASLKKGGSGLRFGGGGIHSAGNFHGAV